MDTGSRTRAGAEAGTARWTAAARSWGACLIALFERAGYYTWLSFAVVYLGELGFGHYWPSLLVGSGLGLLVYGLQVPAGALADRIGFRAALLAGSALLLAGYAALGSPLWAGGRTLAPVIRPEVTVGPDVVVPVLAGLLMISLGRSLLTPTCASLVDAGARGGRAVAFGIYFTLTNAGIMAGLIACWLLRRGPGLEPVFQVAVAASAGALAAALALGRGPAASGSPRTPGPPFREVWAVLRRPGVLGFILASATFFTLFTQAFVLLPLYLKTVVEPQPALDLYYLVTPLVAVTCQLPVTWATRGLAPFRSIALGTFILSLGLLVNALPPLLPGGPRAEWGGVQAGTLAALLALAVGSLGGLLVLPRIYAHLGSLAPPGHKGLFLGLPSLTMALGHLAGGALGPVLLYRVMARGAGMGADGMLEVAPGGVVAGWGVVAGLGGVAAVEMWVARAGSNPST